MPAKAVQIADGRVRSDAASYDAASAIEHSSSGFPGALSDAPANGLNVLYLVHDLNDPSVRRRALMLHAGGAKVTLAGFSRKANPLARIEGVVPIDLGRTHDGRFAQRLVSVGRAALGLPGRIRTVAKPDIILARNLEMLALARRASASFGGHVPVVYECLDIHRLMLRADAVGELLRSAERRLGRNAALLLTSSPAFVENYFERFDQFRGPMELLENKALELDSRQAKERHSPTSAPSAGKPWKIGWFGALRCRRSLDILAAFTRQMEGRFEVVLRGRPAYDQFDDFERQIAAEPFVSFHGPYSNPEDLSQIYGEVHFSWLVDFFEEGLNSDWLLPNRLYEGCRYATVPISMEGTETGRFLQRKGLGILLSGNPETAVFTELSSFDSERYTRAANAVAAEEPKTWLIDREDCMALVHRFAGLAVQAGGALRMPH